MRKTIAIALAVLVLCTLCSGAAAEGFDYAAYQSAPGYVSSHGMMGCDGFLKLSFSDADVYVRIQLDGRYDDPDDSGIDSILLCIDVKDPILHDDLYTIGSVAFLFDDWTYVYQNTSKGKVMLIENAKALVNAIAEAKSMQLAIECDGILTDPPISVSEEELSESTLQALAKCLMELDPWSNLSLTGEMFMEDWEEKYPLIIGEVSE